MSIFDGLASWVPSALGIAGALAANNNSKGANNRAANGATYNPANVVTPFGASTYTLQNGRPTYTTTPGAYGSVIPQLTQLANTGYGTANKFAKMTPEQIAQQWNPQAYSAYQGANAALTGLQGTANDAAGQFGNLAAAGTPGATAFESGQGPLSGNANTLFNNSTDFLKNTDPTQLYQILSNMAKPGDTTATQSLFDHLQATGRLGLTQNGELGDIGGLQLAQQTADNQRRAQAYQFGQQNAIAGGNLGAQLYNTGNQNMSTLADLLRARTASKGMAADAAGQIFNNAGTLNNMGSTDLQNAITTGNTGLTGMETINQNMMLPMAAGNQAAANAASAGANAAPYTVGASQGTTDLLSTLAHGFLNGTGTPSSGVVDKIKNLFNPNGGPTSTITGSPVSVNAPVGAASAAADAGMYAPAAYDAATGVAGSGLGAAGTAAAGIGDITGGAGLAGGAADLSGALGASALPDTVFGGALGSGAGAGLGAAAADAAATSAAGAGLGSLAGAGGADAALSGLAASTPALPASTFAAAEGAATPAAAGVGSIANVLGPAAIAAVGVYDLYHLFTDANPLNDTMMASAVAKGGPLSQANSNVSKNGAVTLAPLTQHQLNAMLSYPGSFTSPDWARYYPNAFTLVNGQSVPKKGLSAANASALQPSQTKVMLPNAKSYVGPHG
jgi:hypothetical protein